MLKSTDLKQVLMSPEGFPNTFEILREGLSDGVAPGFVAGFWQAKRPDQYQVLAMGQRRIFPSSQPVLAETPFDLASVSKVFATAPLCALLVDRKWIRWETPLKSFFPQLSYRGETIELRHLLSHTAGFAAWEPYWQKIRERFAPCALDQIDVRERQLEMRKLVFETPPQVRPGERVLYSDISFLLLGFVLEEATQMPLDRAVKRLLWDPMGLQDARYYRTKTSLRRAPREEVAATEKCPWRGQVLQGQVHDDNCWAMGGYSGHAGAFASAGELLHFARALIGGFLTRETLEKAWTRVADPPGCERTLGWDTPSGPNPALGAGFSKRSIGHLGFTGTSFWIDPEENLAIALLSNRVHPSRENEKIRGFRPRFHQALRKDLNDSDFRDNL